MDGFLQTGTIHFLAISGLHVGEAPYDLNPCVEYRDGVVSDSGITARTFVAALSSSSAKPEIEHEDRRILIELLEIQDKFSDKLQNAS